MYITDWILRTDYGLDGDSLSYEDRMERRSVEEERRAKERQLMEEGRYLILWDGDVTDPWRLSRACFW